MFIKLAASLPTMVNDTVPAIRVMSAADIERVSAIECACSASPWSRKQFEHSLDDAKGLSIVLLADGEIIGFAVLSTVLDEAELHNIAIDPSRQASGFGACMLDYLLTNLPAEIKTTYLEVRVSNFRAIRLYQQRGFVKVGERRDYYKTELGCEDGLLMSRQTDTDPT